MPVSLRFRCQYCDAQPDPLTQISLVSAMRQMTFGEYQDALPGRWLIFHARGLFGPDALRLRGPPRRPRRLPARALRRDRPQVWRRPPYPSSLAHSDMDNAWNIATTRRTGGP